MDPSKFASSPAGLKPMPKVGKSMQNTDPIQQYCNSLTIKLEPILQELQDASMQHQFAMMSGAPETTCINMNYMRLIKAKRVLDVGTFTGISALAAALVIPEDGEVISMDITDQFYNDVGKKIIEKSGVAKKIKLELRPAFDTLKQLISAGQSGTFDFAFIDAGNKEGYPEYYELCKTLVRPGGVMVFDNVLWHGSVVNEANFSDGAVAAFRKVNQMAFDDPEVDSQLLNAGDGMLVVYKKWAA